MTKSLKQESHFTALGLRVNNVLMRIGKESKS